MLELGMFPLSLCMVLGVFFIWFKLYGLAELSPPPKKLMKTCFLLYSSGFEMLLGGGVGLIIDCFVFFSPVHSILVSPS